MDKECGSNNTVWCAWYGMRCKRIDCGGYSRYLGTKTGAAVGEKVSRQSRLLGKEAAVTDHYSH